MIALAVVLTGCGGSGGSSSGTDEPFRVYASLSLSGSLAEIGKAERDGLEAATQVLNDADGIGGREVELEVVDDGSDPAQAVSLLQRELTSGQQPDLVWPGTTSNVTLALCPVLMREEVLALGITASTDIRDLDRCGYNFVMGPTPADSQAAVAQRLAELGHQQVGVLLSNDAYGSAVKEAVEETFPEQGVEITAITRFEPDALDASPQLRELRETDPDALFIEGQGAAIGKVLESRQQLGWDVPVVGGTGFGGSNVAALVGPDALENVTMWHWAVGVEGTEPVAERFEQTALPAIKEASDGKLAVASNLYAGGYDALMVAEAAARTAGSTDPTEMRDTLRSFAESPPSDPQWVMVSEYPYTSTKNFSGLTSGDFALALPRELDEQGQVPPAEEAG